MKTKSFWRIFGISCLLLLLCAAVLGCSEDVCEHAWDEGKIEAPATPEGDGVMSYTCTLCGEVRKEPLSYATQEEGIYQAVRAAYQDASEFKGELFCEITQVYTEGDAEETAVRKVYQNDLTGEYAEAEYYGGDLDESTVVKQFFLHEKAYAYDYFEYSESIENGTTHWYEHEIRQVPEAYIKQTDSLLASSDQWWPKETFTAQSMAELKNAFATVWASDTSVSDAPTVLAKTVGNQSVLSLTATGINDFDCTDLSLTWIAENGKLISIETVLDYGEGTVYELQITFSYGAGRDFFDALEVPLPEDLSEIAVDETLFDEYAAHNTHRVELLYEDGTHLAWSERFTWEYDAWDDYFADMWYTDEACTQPFDPRSITETSWVTIDTLYTSKAALQQHGVSLVLLKEWDDTSKISDAYRIVLPDWYFWDRTEVLFFHGNLVFDLPYVGVPVIGFWRASRVLLNGEDITASAGEEFDTSVLSTGEVYTLEIITDCKESDYTLSDFYERWD